MDNEQKNIRTALFFRSIDDLYQTVHAPCISLYYGTSTILNVEVFNYRISVLCHMSLLTILLFVHA